MIVTTLPNQTYSSQNDFVNYEIIILDIGHKTGGTPNMTNCNVASLHLQEMHRYQKI